MVYSDFLRYFEENAHFSVKQSQTMPIYFRELTQIKDKEDIVLVEFGVAGGGSLHFYRKILGSKARIIGVDLNPECKKMESQGFEIHIGDQSDPKFLADFFVSIESKIDVLIDDGGHTNAQQIRTIRAAIPFIKNGGILIIDDLHCSYHHRWGNPSRYSTINYLKRQIDVITKRNPILGSRYVDDIFSRYVFGIRFYDALCVIEIDSELSKPGFLLTSDGNPSDYRTDFRYSKSKTLESVYRISKVIENQQNWIGKSGFFMNTVLKVTYLRLTLLKLIRLIVRMIEFRLGNGTRSYFK
jgi:Methyltransferase domain